MACFSAETSLISLEIRQDSYGKSPVQQKIYPYPAIRLFNISPRPPWRHIFRPDCVKNPCNPSGFCNRRIERLCRIIVHDPSVKRRMAALSALSPPQAGPRMGSLHDMDCCGFLPCRTKNLSRQSEHAEILNRLLGAERNLTGFSAVLRR